jgi:hypothetical protein
MKQNTAQAVFFISFPQIILYNGQARGKRMKKYTDSMDIRQDPKLDSLLSQRRAPLSEEGLNTGTERSDIASGRQVLSLRQRSIQRKSTLAKIDIHASDIDRADVMQGTDELKYFPAFTDIDRLRKWKPSLKKGEFIYLMDKQDLLDFLDRNEKIAAVVLNPMEDDLLLYRMQLQNMIKVGSEKERKE